MSNDMANIKAAIMSRIKGEKSTISPQSGKVMPSTYIEKKKSNIKRVITGIPGLDQEIQGGFVRKSVNLVAGGPGSGKSIFAMQFIANGIIESNESGIYISFEEKKENFYMFMKEFGWDLNQMEKDNKFRFVRYSPGQVYRLLEEGGGMIDAIVNEIGAKRIVIDSITAFTLLHKDELTTREALLSLFAVISNWECTTLMTAEQESDPEKHSPDIVEFEVDGVIGLYNLRKKNIRQRVAEVLKMRGTKFSSKIFPVKITDNGFVFYPNESVY